MNATMNNESKLTGRMVLVVFFAFLAYVLDIMDWNLLTFSAPVILKEMGFTGTQMGFLLGAPMLGGGIGGLFAGWFADKLGRKKAMIITLCWFSIFTILFPFGKTFAMLMTLRLLAGLGLGAQWGIGNTIVAETIARKFAMRASALVQSAGAIGPLLGAFVVMQILPVYGWKPIFYVGALGLVLALFVGLFLKESDIWLAAKDKHQAGETKLADLSLFLKQPNLKRFILFFIMLVFCAYAYYGAMSWIPTWLATTKGFGVVKSMGYMVALNLGGFFGYFIAAYIADKFGRKPPAIAYLLLSVLGVLIFVSVKDPGTLMWIAPLYAFLTYPFFGLVGGYATELFPTEIRSTAINALWNVARMFAFFAPTLLAWVGTKTSLTFAIGCTAVMYLLAALPLVFLPETKHANAFNTSTMSR